MSRLSGLVKVTSVAAFISLQGACVGPPIIPVQEVPTAGRGAEERVVRLGDTLYNIAWEAGVDYRRLAQWNNIPPPYVIKPGQRIRLKSPPSAQQSVATTSPVPAQSSGTESQSLDVVTTTKPSQRNADTQIATAPTTTQSKASVQLPNKVSAWSWPAKGKIIYRFAPDDNKGIDIAGNAGTPIQAAADGAVVYAGNGLRGYGQLIILKHSEQYLSAYAHHRKILVREGDAVKRGQTIAEMGNSGTDRTKLHFEIRRNGKPVDPLGFLPRKQT